MDTQDPYLIATYVFISYMVIRIARAQWVFRELKRTANTLYLRDVSRLYRTLPYLLPSQVRYASQTPITVILKCTSITISLTEATPGYRRWEMDFPKLATVRNAIFQWCLIGFVTHMAIGILK